MSRWAEYLFMGRQLSDGGAETHDYFIEIARGSRFELMWGYVQPESTAETCFVIIEDAASGGDVLGNLRDLASVAAGVRAVFPDRRSYAATPIQSMIGYAGGRIILPGGLFLHAAIQNVNDFERSRCVMHGRVRGDKPTATMSGGSGTSELLHDEMH